MKLKTICLLFFTMQMEIASSGVLKKNEKILKSSNESSNKLAEKELEIPEDIQKTLPKELQLQGYLQMIINLVKEYYVDDLSDQELFGKTISSFISSLDLHSLYLNEKDYNEIKNITKGEFGGIGVEVTMHEGTTYIISALDNTPAYKAGVESGDIILSVDDELINELSLSELTQKLRGPEKTKVKLKIKRKKKDPFDVIIQREIIKVNSVNAEILHNIAYIRISTFDDKVSKNLKSFFQNNDIKKIKGIVLDIRNNSGGLVDEAIAVADFFMDGGKIFSTKGKNKEVSKEFFARKNDETNGIPMVVIINNSSASASEIVAGALQDNNRAILVGDRSFGKGSIQNLIPITEKIAVKLTVAKYYTPSGKSIQANGVTPDIQADSGTINKDDFIVIREECFKNSLDSKNKEKNKKESIAKNKEFLNALNNKKTENDESSYRKLSLNEKLIKDYQLNKAFAIIDGIIKFKEMEAKNNAKK